MGRPKRVLFEHIPKCGGTTISNYLKSNYNQKRIYELGSNPTTSVDYYISLPEKERRKYDLIIGHGAHRLLNYIDNDFIKLTIFRDPIERIISHYYFVMKSPRHYLHKEIKDKDMTLADYVTSGISGELRNNYVCRFLEISAKEAERNPQESIMRAYEIIQNEYTVFGILEKIEKVMNAMSKLACYKKKYTNNRANTTHQKPAVSCIDKSTKNLISEVNFLDIKLYDLIKNAI